MLKHLLIAALCILFGLALAQIYIKHLKRSANQKWPKANPEAWNDEEDDW